MISLERETEIYVRQRRELAELFGFETRNKYEISRSDRSPIGYVAEQSKGLLGFFGRQFLGHWRRFELHFFTPERHAVGKAVHPFRWFFQRLDLYDAQNRLLGSVQQRFAIIRKKFDVLDANGSVLLEMESPFWKIWTFPFRRGGQEVACLRKKWAGVLSEAFTDKDNFEVAFSDPGLRNTERLLILASAIFVDLIYFEKKANSD